MPRALLTSRRTLGVQIIYARRRLRDVAHASPPVVRPRSRARRYHGHSMEPPVLTRRRRPFLAPLWLTALAVVVMAVIAWTAYRAAGTTVVLLVPTSAGEPGGIADPPISAEGEEQAQRLAHLLG